MRENNLKNKRIFLILRMMVDLGIIHPEDVRGNPNLNPKKPFAEILVKLIKEGKVDENKVKDFFVKRLSFKPFDFRLQDVNLSDEILQKFPISLVKERYVVPFEYTEGVLKGVLKVAVLSPMDRDALSQIRLSTDVKIVDVYVATLSEIKELEKIVIPLFSARKFLDGGLGLSLGADMDNDSLQRDSSVVELPKESQDDPIVKVVNTIISEAINLGALDIHIEPMGKELKVRFRVDGVLREYENIPMRVRDEIIGRIKMMSCLDASEKMLLQDGRIRFEVGNRNYDLRVSTLPTIYGEKVVIRIQDIENYLNVKFEDLGFEEDNFRLVKKAVYSSWGMVLVVGPRGSGKTTTLYSALMERNTPDVNIVTIEDPVEVSILGVNQVQVKEDAGLTFASVLRAFLRQDPDIILVGEIRDKEIAEMSLKASLTGHLVFSTLHTKNTLSAIARLIGMGVDRYLVSSAVHTIIAQRLIRKLCDNCKRPANHPPILLKCFGFSDEDIEVGHFFVRNPDGCDRCGGTGYKGRTAVHEVLRLDENIINAINEGKTVDELKEIAIKSGMRTLYKDGLMKVKKGITDMTEIRRVLMN